jgi:hypothetical protein
MNETPWRSLGDSNPCFRRERATFGPVLAPDCRPRTRPITDRRRLPQIRLPRAVSADRRRAKGSRATRPTSERASRVGLELRF